MAIIEASKKEESDQEVVANNLDVHPQVFGLCMSRDIIEQVPDKINVKQLYRLVFTCREMSRGTYFWA